VIGLSGGAAGADPTAVTLDTVAEALADHPPRRDRSHEPWQAAVAVALSPGPDGLAIAFIQRSRRAGDRWSGQMALPGGRRDAGDRDLAATAVRETAEEVGVLLPSPLGRLADQRGRVSRGHVAAFVFGLSDRPELSPQPGEADTADWIPLTWLFDPANAVHERWTGVPFPGIAHRDRVIWGLTHRILDDFASVVGLRLPRP
jgi:8-oxo-dGTP pyrophosphatase MutT (NUDIX family)